MFDTSKDYEENEYERPNKSKIKREVQALQDLAKKLVNLNEAQWSELGLPEAVVEGLQALQTMPQHVARKRQLKLVGKLLRDADVSKSIEAVEVKSLKHSESSKAFHHVERWRDRLLEEGQDVLTTFLVKYPDADVQHMRHLIRNAQKERVQGKSPKSSRLLFKFIKGVCG